MDARPDRRPNGDKSAVIPAIRPARAQPSARAASHRRKSKQSPRVRVVVLRATKTDEGYRSIHSELTRRTFGTALRTVARTTGEVLISLGLVVLLFGAYEVWGKVAELHDHQNALDNQVGQAWDNPAVGPSGPAPSGLPGNAIARMYIPRLNLHWVVVEGVGLKDIRYGPGHYPGTAMPGQLGNFAVAGHRSPGIFWDLDRVGPGDLIIVETRTNWYVYQVFLNHIVTPHSLEVIAAKPNVPGAAPTEPDMTLTTCNPRWNNYQRMAVHARLIDTTTHDRRPKEFGG